MLVDRDQVIQSQDEDAAATIVITTEVTDSPVETGPIIEQPGVADQGAKQRVAIDAF